MKKFLVYVFAIALAATTANAGLLQISVGGNFDPVDSEITLAPSDHIELNIHVNGDIGPFEAHDWALVVNTNFGSINGGVAQVVSGFNQLGGSAPDLGNGVLADSPLAGIWGNMANTTFDNIASGTVLVDGIDFHCVGPGDAVIQLYEITSGAAFPSQSGTLVDQVIIHQIPEPISMSLLALGGLGLIRRRRRA